MGVTGLLERTEFFYDVTRLNSFSFLHYYNYANLRLSVPSLWPYLGNVSIHERQPGKIMPEM